MESAASYTEKAAHCRRLAKVVDDDYAAAALSALAEENEILAAQSRVREALDKPAA